jgi:hypothetical protein
MHDGGEAGSSMKAQGKNGDVSMKFVLLVFSLLVVSAACQTKPDPPMVLDDRPFEWPPTEWEHGWKTKRVVATRYTNQMMGYNIGFTFPENIHNSDGPEVSKFMEAHGGWVYSSGGHPGAEMFVVFKDVKDKNSANKKLQQILPALDQLMQDISTKTRLNRHAGDRVDHL